MPQGPKPPAYVIPTTEVWVVMYLEKQAVGIQFVDPNGDQVFVSVPGSGLPHRGKSIPDLATKMPDVLNWQPAKL